MNKEGLILAEMEKREEIINSFDKNYLLEAGAGAGKTTIIVQRIINHIINTGVKPSSIVAITFTKAASTELAERIQKKALEYIRGGKYEGVRDRLESIDEIFTGTIHSFCDLILREMPFEAGLTPGYEIIEDSEDFLNNIWYEFIRKMEDRIKDKTDLLWKLGIDFRDLREKAILAMENTDVSFVGYKVKDEKFEDIERDFESLKAKHRSLQGDRFKKNSNISKLFIAILEEGAALSSYVNPILKDTGKYEWDAEESYDKVIAKKYLDAEERPAYEEFFTEVYNIYHRLNALGYNTSTDLINMALDYKNKNFKGQLTFNDLLYRASQLIKNSPSAREHFKNKYKYYYIDEFQDTDPIQADLVLNLTDKEDFQEGKYWQDCKPRDGSLFVVGDPKQSIYRFRRADIGIYNQVKEIIDKNGELVYLDINFRSSDEVCNWVESTFKKGRDDFGFEEESTMVQAGFKGILSLWDDNLQGQIVKDKSQIRGIYKYDNISGEDGYLPSEEEYVAKLVEDIMGNHYIVEKERISPDQIEEGGKDYVNTSRSIEPRDVMILTKSNAETGRYLRALKDRNIPALLAGEKNLGDTREVLNLFSLVDLLLDYRDHIKIVGVLRNCFYLDLDTIDLFLEDEKSLSSIMFQRRKIEKIQHPQLKNAFLYLWELSSSIRNHRPITFIEGLIRDRLGIYNMFKSYNQVEENDIESALIQTIELLKSKTCASIYELRDELEKLVNNQVSYELPLNSEFANNATRVMNIHKAKGLEANLVFLVGRDKNTSLGFDSHYLEKDAKNNNLGYMIYKRDHGLLGPNEREKKENEKAFKLAENHRLLYVAATRAKSVLIIPNTADEKRFLYPINKNIVNSLGGEIKVEDRGIYSLDNYKKRELEITRRHRIRKRILDPSYIKISPSQFENLDSESYDTYGRFSSPKLTSTRPKKARDIFKPRGRVYGNIIHRAMEILIQQSRGLENLTNDIIDYTTRMSVDESLDSLEINRNNIGLFYPLNSKSLDRVLNSRVSDGSKKSRDIIRGRLEPFVKADLNNFANNEEILGLFKNANRVFTEFPFSIALDTSNKEVMDKLSRLLGRDQLREIYKKTTVVNGVIDLLVESKDGSWTILDYKTDTVLGKDPASILGKKYGSQLRGYKIFLEEALKDQGIEVEELIIYSTFGDNLIYLLESPIAQSI